MTISYIRVPTVEDIKYLCTRANRTPDNPPPIAWHKGRTSFVAIIWVDTLSYRALVVNGDPKMANADDLETVPDRLVRAQLEQFG